MVEEAKIAGARTELAAPERVPKFVPPCPDVFSSRCTSREILDLIADKWSVLVLGALMGGTLRHAELRRKIEGISQKMLTQTLRHLERNGLVRREIYPEVPPRVEYSLTDLGDTLAVPISVLTGWAEAHIDEISAARARADAAASGPPTS